jgi:two-component system, NarL family, nitrate/nitrite sensor histidine kinase NarX
MLLIPVIVFSNFSTGIMAALCSSILLINLFLLWKTYDVIDKQLFQPIEQLKYWINNIKENEYSVRMTPILTGDFKDISLEINEIGEEIQGLYDDMDAMVLKQTKRLVQKTTSLEILYDVAVSLNKKRNIQDLLTHFLHTLKTILNAESGTIRLLQPNHKTQLVADVGLAPDNEAKQHCLMVDQCLCEEVISNGQIRIKKGVTHCLQNNHMLLRARHAGMIIVPLQYRGKIMGIYNLFVKDYREIENNDIHQLLTSIGNHLGMAIERSRLDEEAKNIAVMEERNLLAGELHDSLAQTVAGLKIQFKMLKELLNEKPSNQVQTALDKLTSGLNQANSEVRNLITHFRIPLDKQGFLPAVNKLVDHFRSDTGIATFLQIEDEFFLPSNCEIQVLRILQEALANIKKHSQATSVRIWIQQYQKHYKMIIEDNGKGYTPQPPNIGSGEHLGLSLMQDRAHSLSGTLTIEGEVDEGTRVILNFDDISTPQPTTSFAVTHDLL